MLLFATKPTLARDKVVAEAVERFYKISAKDYPNVCKFLSYAALKALNSDNFDKGRNKNMSISYNLSKQISFLDAAIKEVLAKTKNYQGIPLITFVDKDTDFTGMVMNLSKKYLSFYKSDEDRYDILVSAFEEIFLGRPNKMLTDFDGEYQGKPVAIEGIIKMILGQAIIRASQNKTDYYKRLQTIHPYEDETDDDAFDRAVEKKLDKFSADDEILWEQIKRDVNKKFDKFFARSPEPDRAGKVLDMLLLGYSQTEIANKFGISNTRVGDLIKKMKEAIKEVAEDYDRKGDSVLLKEFMRATK
jgi:hypothetical protein